MFQNDGHYARFTGVLLLVGFMGLVSSGCMSEEEWMHAHMDSWSIEICDGRGGRLHLLRGQRYYELLAQALLHEDAGVRTAAILGFTTGVHVPGRKYVYLLDAYIDNGQGRMLAGRLAEALTRSSPKSTERRRILQAIIQLRMREYLWAHPQFGEGRDLDPLPPPRKGFRMFWRDHYPLFAERLLLEKDNEFADHWQQYREVMRCLYDRDPASEGR